MAEPPRRIRVIWITALLCGGCTLSEPVKVAPERGRTGLRDVEASQRDVNRTLRDYRRQQEAARRDALFGDDE